VSKLIGDATALYNFWAVMSPSTAEPAQSMNHRNSSQLVVSFDVTLASMDTVNLTSRIASSNNGPQEAPTPEPRVVAIDNVASVHVMHGKYCAIPSTRRYKMYTSRLARYNTGVCSGYGTSVGRSVGRRRRAGRSRCQSTVLSPSTSSLVYRAPIHGTTARGCQRRRRRAASVKPAGDRSIGRPPDGGSVYGRANTDRPPRRPSVSYVCRADWLSHGQRWRVAFDARSV